MADRSMVWMTREPQISGGTIVECEKRDNAVVNSDPNVDRRISR